MVAVLDEPAGALHVPVTLARAGVFRPTRPDRLLRTLVGLHRWGPTLAGGYLGCAARYPDGSAIIDERGTFTSEEVDRRTNALARRLAARDVEEGTGVAIMCRNHRGFVEASVACSKLGAHALYLNTLFAGPRAADAPRTSDQPVRASLANLRRHGRAKD
jgi:non-ribosomal peptide synthetase component E (peptide arylation enzyme)